MKKIILTTILALILVGCGSNVSNVDINSTSKIIEQKLTNMQSIQDSTLTDVYNLDLSTMNEHIFKENTNGDLYAIINTNQKNEVKEMMNEYFSKIREFNVAYSPERLQILDDRLEREIGNTLIYIIAGNAEEIYNDILNEID